MQAVPTSRLAAFYFFNFVILGLFLPYWPLYLQARGFSPSEIGELLAVMLATRIVAPNFWGWLADRQGRPVEVIRLTSLMALLCFLWVFVADSFITMALMLAAMGWFWNASLPQFEAITLRFLGQSHERYGRLRAWGSIGFVVAVLLGGELLSRLGYLETPHLMWPALLMMTVAALLLPRVSLPAESHSAPPLLSVLKQRPVITLLVLVCLMQMSHAVYYTFFSVWMQQQGYSASFIGGLWSFGVLAEIAVFWITGKLLQRWSAESLLLFSLAITALRWQLIAHWPDQLALVLLAQLFHAITYGVYHAAAIQLIHAHFRDGLDARGQGLYSSISFGVGGAVGAYLMGNVWQSWGAMPSFGLASGLALGGFFLGLMGFGWRTSQRLTADRRNHC